MTGMKLNLICVESLRTLEEAFGKYLSYFAYPVISLTYDGKGERNFIGTCQTRSINPIVLCHFSYNLLRSCLFF